MPASEYTNKCDVIYFSVFQKKQTHTKKTRRNQKKKKLKKRYKEEGK